MDKRSTDIEGAVMEAAIFAEIVAQWMATCIGMDRAEPPDLCAEDCKQIYWAVNTLASMTKLADDAYHNRKAKEATNA